MKKLSCQMTRLIRICVRGHDGRIGVLYLIAILILGFCGIAVSLRMIAWSAAFYDALQRVDGNEILKQIGVFAALTLTSAVLYLIGRCLQQVLQIRWRTALTDEVLSRWLRNQTHWKLRLGGQGVDNPDQRIAEDCRLFAQLFITQGLGLVNELVAVVSYFSVLWSLSTFALSIRLFGASVEIPRYMVWAAPLYVLLASMLTHALGTPLRKLNLAQQKREADFRFSLGYVRKSSESIALQMGERTERRILDGLYAQIVANWKLLIKRELILGCFTRPYMQTVLRIPVFLALPAFIAGKLTLGGLMQTASAFSNVVTTLSWFIFSYRDLAELAATATRLGQFLAVCDQADSMESGISVIREAGSRSLSFEGLVLNSPKGDRILAVPDLTLQAGENVWISGASGAGKSTFFRALAELWPYGQGQIHLPGQSLFFLPQQPHFPPAGLTAAAVYPMSVAAFSKQELEALKRRTEIAWEKEDRSERSGDEAAIGLSGGERQRLCLLRVIANKPGWAFLDEPSSALDECTARQMLQLLYRELPGTTFVIVAHGRPVGMPIHKVIDFQQ
ncbi:ABC transporter ATP-binding protein/permease [Achromobacter xylosoxidans]|uniref:ABC transporter ATP-binding protein/permease n=1 Tax=Alcaligenes xylosoxydans xylosoxydans TaxID=85698 RepID=UPI000AF02724|nr:SbmA/BacA-like family transporter [Achromobacter xylosoxidans]PWV42632.1 ABC transporter permease [Achromobacter xylosoxidans]